MSESVVFDYNDFIALYPELNADVFKAEGSFKNACLILNNTPNSVIKDLCERKHLLYLLTAHIYFLAGRGAGNLGSISNAHEGSVGVGYSTSSVDKLGAGWYGQTQYGLMFWMATAKYRSGFYVPEC